MESKWHEEHRQRLCRHLYKMKLRIQYFTAVGLILLLLALAWFASSIGNLESEETFPAAITRDCAPWDGAAFTVSIPYEPGSLINISIWRAPHLKLPTRFLFPDAVAGGGAASLLLRFSYSQPLRGTVFFWGVQPGKPVQGQFDLLTEAGQPLRGRFRAEWKGDAVFCG